MDRIGRYQIVRELGRGAMGVVYLATDPTIGRQVAIKTIRLSEVTNAAERARLRERLFREARSAGKLSHPGIVTIYDMDEQGDVAFIAMEYVEGPTLDDLLSGSGMISSQRMFSILGQTAVALDYAHQKGIVHRDIKPANIMIDGEGTAKITDFGIAKVSASEQFTMTGAILGTPHYMSPEQVQGLPVDGRSDQFSLCVIAYEMLTGEKPFTGDQLTTVVYKIVAEEPASIQRLNPTLSLQIESVIRKGLSKKPESRYATCQKLVDALEDACRVTKGWRSMTRGAGLTMPTVSTERRPAVLPPLRQRRSAETTAAEEQRKSGFFPFLMAILVAAGLIALIAWQAGPWLTDSFSKQTTVPPPAAAPEHSSPAKATGPPAADGIEGRLGPPGGAESRAPSGAAGPTGTQSAAAPPAEAPPDAAPAPAPDTQPPHAAKPPRSTPPDEQPDAEARPVQPPVRERREPSRSAGREAGPFTILVPTIPAGAIAMLDGRPDMACTTPCKLDAMPGQHTVAVRLPGQQTETRLVEVRDGPVELPLINLRGASGTLMLSSVPAGAAIYVNGRLWPKTTPSQISLAPGMYTITVEKDGKRSSREVTVQNGGTSFMRILIAP